VKKLLASCWLEDFYKQQLKRQEDRDKQINTYLHILFYFFGVRPEQTELTKQKSETEEIRDREIITKSFRKDIIVTGNRITNFSSLILHQFL
jgi:hypothetical protein